MILMMTALTITITMTTTMTIMTTMTKVKTMANMNINLFYFILFIYSNFSKQPCRPTSNHVMVQFHHMSIRFPIVSTKKISWLIVVIELSYHWHISSHVILVLDALYTAGNLCRSQVLSVYIQWRIPRSQLNRRCRLQTIVSCHSSVHFFLSYLSDRVAQHRII